MIFLRGNSFPLSISVRSMKLLVLLASATLTSAFFSLKYYISGEDAQISHTMTFTRAPSAKEVALLVHNLCGAKDIGETIAIEKDTLPRMTATGRKMPLLVDLHGGMLPARMITEVVQSNNFVDGSRGPSIMEVVDILHEKDVDMSARVFDGSEGKTEVLVDMLNALPAGQPVIILHHENPAEYHFQTRRRLDNADNSSYVEPPTGEQIADFNIVLWTAVGLIFIVYAAVAGVANMEVIPDSILYAKFTSGRSKKNN